MIWTPFEILINLFQGYIIQKFMESRLHIIRPHHIQDILCVLALTSFLSLYYFFDVQIPEAIGFVIPFIYGLIVAEDKWYVCAFWTVVLAILFLSITSLSLYVFSSIPGSSFKKIMGTTEFRILFVVITNVILATVIYLTSKMKKDYTVPYWSVLFLFLLINIGLLIIEESLYMLQLSIEYSKQPNSLPFLWAYMGLYACTIFVVLLFHMMSKTVERENRYKIEAGAIEQSKHYQEELEQMYSNLIATKHDLKQHIETLTEMVQSGGGENAKHYLSTYQECISSNKTYFTGSTSVDALLMAKSLTMKRSQLQFHYTPYPLNELPISEPHFCTIVGNLLDNAIEGCLRIPRPHEQLTIHLTFSRSWDMFYIFCKNPCNTETLHSSNGKWISSKDKEGQPGLHSIGIRSIEHITKSAEGRCAFQVNNGIFSVKIVIPYGERKDNNNYDD